jgi:hypothetical protein
MNPIGHNQYRPAVAGGYVVDTAQALPLCAALHKKVNSICGAPKARNLIAWGKRRAQRDASPLDHNPNDYQALKERNNYLDISHFQCSFQSNFFYPGATRFALLSACPWLSYSAPLALRPRDSDFLCKAHCACTLPRVVLTVSRSQVFSVRAEALFCWLD